MSRLHTPSPDEPQLTLRAVLAGGLLGGMISAMNIYFGLRTGWSIGGSLVAAILAIGLFTLLRPKQPYSLLEANITQTTGSAAGSMASAGGLVAAIPALGMLGYRLDYLEMSLWVLAVAFLGVFFAIPLRHQMIVVEQLRFPAGTATAEMLCAMLQRGGDALSRARALIIWAVLAAGFTLVCYFVPQVGAPEMAWVGLAGVAAWGFKPLISPMLAGTGMIIGPRVGASLLLGALVGWGILGPHARERGWAGEEIMSHAGGVRGWLLWPGVAIMLGDAASSLMLSTPVLLRFLWPTKGPPVPEDGETIPNAWWLIGLAAASVLTVTATWLVFAIPPVLTLIAILLSSVLATIAVRSVGETDINPTGSVSKVTQLVFGGLAPGRIDTNLMAAGISKAGASQAGDMMQDLKTGYLLGASPRHQLVAQLCGIPVGVICCVPIYALFDAAYEMGGEDLPAPAAHSWKAMAELMTKGLEALPPNAGTAVLVGLVVGFLLPVLRRLPLVTEYIPSGLAAGVAFIVPAYYSIAMGAGSLVPAIWRRRAPAHAERFLFPVASGLIVGEGLMGIVTALLTLLGIRAIT